MRRGEPRRRTILQRLWCRARRAGPDGRGAKDRVRRLRRPRRLHLPLRDPRPGGRQGLPEPVPRPRPHGDRALRAALAVRDWAADDGLQVRVAVNTGEAIVSLEARPGHGEAMVAGDVVNTAARLQSAAPVGSVLVGEETYTSTRGID